MTKVARAPGRNSTYRKLSKEDKAIRAEILRKRSTIVGNLKKGLTVGGVCQEWLDDPESFVIWSLESGFQLGLKLFRIDSKAEFCPANCLWNDSQSFQDLAGNVYGKLTVIKRTDNKSGDSWLWECLCECGKITSTTSSKLKSGHTRSCGCILSNYKDGRSKSPVHKAYMGMHTRCDKENYHQYESYGGRGITICDEWRSDFWAFHHWALTNGWEEGLTLDRVDVDGNYEPSNCRWATVAEQNDNRRNTLYLEYEGKRVTASKFSRLTEVPTASITYYLGLGVLIGEDIIKRYKRRK